METEDFFRFAMQTLMEHSLDMVFFKNTDLIYLAASDSFARMVGLDKGLDIVGKTDYDIFESALAKKYTEDDREVLASGSNIECYIEPIPDQAGKKRYSSTSKYVVRGGDGTIIGLCGVSRDVTAQVELEAEREARQLSRLIFDDVLEADLTENQMLQIEGSAWMRVLGIQEGSSFTSVVSHMKQRLIHPDYQEDFTRRYDRDGLIAGFSNGCHEFTHITYLRVDESDYRWKQCQTRVYHSRISDTLRITTFFRDVDDETKSKQVLQRQADTDGLTGLHNRVSVMERIVQAAETGAAFGTQALFFVDLDCFKQINDRQGHRFGDGVLIEVADRLRRCAGEQSIFGRIGGDEFLLFIWGMRSKREVEERARQLVEMLTFQFGKGNGAVLVSCSVGVVLRKLGTLNMEPLCEQADRAMYRAKENGRSQFFFYEDL